MTAMDSCEFADDYGVTRWTFRILSRKWKELLVITIFTIVSYSALFVANNFINPLISDLSTKIYLLIGEEPDSSGFKKSFTGIEIETAILFLVIWAISFNLWTVMFCSTVSTICVSSSVQIHSWKKLLITWVYVSVFSSEFVIVAGGLIYVLKINVVSSFWIRIAMWVAFNFYSYFVLIWIISMVISVVEEEDEGCYGFDAIKRASEMIQGRKLHGMGITHAFGLMIIGSSCLLNQKMNDLNQTYDIRMSYGICLTTIIGLVEIFALVVYTGFYYQCKQSHEVEEKILQKLGYNRLYDNCSHVHVNDDLP